ncbi:Unknown protein [Striga hermonthica]|uniref:Pectinesterase inhibitor domain-containing protein n=1 Tax=Striga hermonthica TaxID=68872 RepID=A0A9N7MRK6_STRHE|nr:Unknown protein [Striga hermonthica]
MAHSTLHSLLPIATIFLFIPFNSGDTQSLIGQICRQTSDSSFCRSFFNQHLYTPNTDIKGLAQIAVTQTLIYATNTKIFILKAIESEKDPELKSFYTICKEGYGNLVNEFTSANFDFGKGDYDCMVFHVRNCERFVTDCQNVLGNRARQLGPQFS